MRQTPIFVPPLSPGYAEEDQSREKKRHNHAIRPEEKRKLSTSRA
jgi:hypothetical protein